MTEDSLSGVARLPKGSSGGQAPAKTERQKFICSTTVKNVRQIGFFLQNKANLYMAKIAVSSFVTNEYRKSTIL
jgi:hypothetical protein